MSENTSQHRLLPTAVAALGIVFGDIGTSPIYAFKECVSHGTDSGDVVGVISLILWTLLVLISTKYVGLILRADNQGEGGILALLSLAFPEKTADCSRRTLAIMTSFGLLGAALLYGDGVITPSISVLSSIEGLALLSPVFSKLTVPLTIVILLALFWVQKKGSGSVGKVFGGIMLLWFVSLGLLGVVQVFQHPGILLALNPGAGLHYLFAHASSAVVVLGSVFLAVTGGEALYADLGHFGRKPITLAWNFLVLPALALNYLGQGALVLSSPAASDNPFFLLAPGWALLPLVLLSTAATVIASQALISGVFSLTMQASQMGYLPRIRVIHTSETACGQIYIPPVNFALAVACISLVLGFQSSSALASAYGIAVTLTMLTTTSLFYFASRRVWKWSAFKSGAICGIFALIELAFFASNALKVFHGGWLPLGIGALLFYLMTTWKLGRKVVQEQLETAAPLGDFVASLATPEPGSPAPVRTRGTAVYLTSSTRITPGALVQNLKHNHAVHERVIVLTLVTDNAPRRNPDSRLEIVSFPLGFYQVIAHFGFMEFPTIAEIIACAASQDFPIEIETTSFILGGQNLVLTKGVGLPAWRESAFVLMNRNAEKASAFLRMPGRRTIELMWQVEI